MIRFLCAWLGHDWNKWFKAVHSGRWMRFCGRCTAGQYGNRGKRVDYKNLKEINR